MVAVHGGRMRWELRCRSGLRFSPAVTVVESGSRTGGSQSAIGACESPTKRVRADEIEY